MIFPILNGLMGFRRAPVTWLLFALNLLVLVYTSTFGLEAQRRLEEVMTDGYFLSTQGRVYAQYLEERPMAGYPDYLREVGRQVNHGERGRVELLGQLAFRDAAFLAVADELSFRGDQVAFRIWRQRLQRARELQAEHPSFALGLNSEDTSLAKWFTYIFVHSGAFHFAGNMLFLLVFGAALERQVGGLGVLVTFVLSGVVGAGVFAAITGVTSSPLVGASGAVSGVMTLYCLLNWSRPARYFYWLFWPFRGFMGFVYLPAWVGFVLWALSDLAGYLSSLAELGGVAHAAHLGGEFAALLTACVLFLLRRYRPVVLPDSVPRNVPMGVLIPFLPTK